MRPLDEIAIDLLREHEPPEGYWLAFSGGKDSVVIKHLADRAGVKYRAFYNVTTIDPPEIIYFMRKHHADVEWKRPKQPFLKRMLYMGFPTRIARWCCREYKELFRPDGLMLTGIRMEESAKRKSRRTIEAAINGPTTFVHPILSWASDELWNYIRAENLAHCSLYNNGWRRIGCLFCPNATPSERQMHGQQYPRHEQAFRKAFRSLHAKRTAQENSSVSRWSNGDEMFDWWIRG